MNKFIKSIVRQCASLVTLSVGYGLILTNPAQAYDFDKKLIAPDGAPGDEFGRWSVSLDGDRALIGSSEDDDNGSRSGSAYLFDVITGNFLQKLTAPDGAFGDQFGRSVSLAGDTALIGSPEDDDSGVSSGSAYLFDVSTGNFLQKLTAPDSISGARFGWSVSLDGDTALIGSRQGDNNGSRSGSAYLFEVSTGNFLHKLTPPDGAASDFFGQSVSLAGDRALIGSLGDDDNGSNSGSAYLFEVSTGNFLHKLIAPDGAEFDSFGFSVSLAGDRALIGSPNDDDNGDSSGSAYLFDATTGNFLQKLTAPDGAAVDDFGYSVSLAGDRALIGSPLDDDNGRGSGSAYLFDVSTGNFLQKLTTPDGAEFDLFGSSVSLADNRALISSPADDDNGSESGSAYLFVKSSTSVPEPSNIIALALTLLGGFCLRKPG